MNQQDFKQHIIPLQRPMQLLAERILADSSDAEDMVSDVFLTLWQRRERLDEGERLDSYCLQMVRTRCIDLLRQRNQMAQHADTIRGLTDSEVLLEVEDNERKSRLLHTLLSELPEKQREAVRLKYFENCSTSQMEQSLRMSSSNVYTTLSRALQSLREKLSAYEDSE